MRRISIDHRERIALLDRSDGILLLGVVGRVWRCFDRRGAIGGGHGHSRQPCHLAVHTRLLAGLQRQPYLPEVEYWGRRVTILNLLVSSVWGLVPWLLWQEGNIANHLFLAVIVLAVVARFLASRSLAYRDLLCAIGPVATLLVARALSSATPQDLLLAAIVLGYAAVVIRDARFYTARLDASVEAYHARHDMVEELRRTRDEALKKCVEAEHASKSKTAFLANMSHELRTPLNAILGFSDMIAREHLGPVGSPRYREYANDIHISGSHLLALINDLLDVAKIEAGKMEIDASSLDTQQTLEDSLKVVGVKARERSQSLSVTVAANAREVFADERALKQILINLVSNAVKFTQVGGKIKVSAERNPSGEFVLVVEDNGRGIPKEKLAQIFKPFAQVDNRYDREGAGTGTGLGLALVRGLAEVHGGGAWLESEEGTGTRAYVALPGAVKGVSRLRA